MHQERDFHLHVETFEPRSPKRLIEFLYDLAKLEKPEVLVFENPSSFKQAFQAEELSRVSAVANNIALQIAQAMIGKIAKPQMEAITKHIDYDQLKQKRDANWKNIAHKYTSGLQNLVFQKLQVSSSAIAMHPHTDDLAWKSFLTSIDTVDLMPELKRYFQLLEALPLVSICTPKKAYCLSWPLQITFNQDFTLHNEQSAAISFENEDLYVWKGVEVPKHLILKPNSVTKQEIIKEQNAERRRCYLEVLGGKRFASLLDLEIKQSEIDRQGNLQVLYRSIEKDTLAGDFLQFAQVICPSTKREYFLCVPPYINNCKEAVAWTFGKSAHDYNPSIET